MNHKLTKAQAKALAYLRDPRYTVRAPGCGIASFAVYDTEDPLSEVYVRSSTIEALAVAGYCWMPCMPDQEVELREIEKNDVVEVTG